MTRNATAPNRGRRGATTISAAIPRQPRANSPALTRLRLGTGFPAREKTYQMEPKSPERSALKLQKLRHASGASHSAGRLTSPQLTTNVDSSVK